MNIRISIESSDGIAGFHSVARRRPRQNRGLLANEVPVLIEAQGGEGVQKLVLVDLTPAVVARDLAGLAPVVEGHVPALDEMVALVAVRIPAHASTLNDVALGELIATAPMVAMSFDSALEVIDRPPKRDDVVRAGVPADSVPAYLTWIAAHTRETAMAIAMARPEIARTRAAMVAASRPASAARKPSAARSALGFESMHLTRIQARRTVRGADGGGGFA